MPADEYPTVGYIVSTKSWIAFIILMLAFVSPVLHYHTHVALVNVTPSTDLVHRPTWNPDGIVDGPSVFIGLLGSCYRLRNNAPVKCTTASALDPVYDTHVLPSFGHLLNPLPGVGVAMAVGVALLGAATVFITAMSTSSLMGKRGAWLEAPWVYYTTTWSAVVGFVIASVTWGVTRLFLGKAVRDFNLSIEEQGSAAPELKATIGHGATLFWVVFFLYIGPPFYLLGLLRRKVMTPPAAPAPGPAPDPPPPPPPPPPVPTPIVLWTVPAPGAAPGGPQPG